MTSWAFVNMALKEATRTRHDNEENNEHTMAIEEQITLAFVDIQQIKLQL